MATNGETATMASRIVEPNGERWRPVATGFGEIAPRRSPVRIWLAPSEESPANAGLSFPWRERLGGRGHRMVTLAPAGHVGPGGDPNAAAVDSRYAHPARSETTTCSRSQLDGSFGHRCSGDPQSVHRRRRRKPLDLQGRLSRTRGAAKALQAGWKRERRPARRRRSRTVLCTRRAMKPLGRRAPRTTLLGRHAPDLYRHQRPGLGGDRSGARDHLAEHVDSLRH